MKIKLIAPRMSLRPMDSAYKRRMAPSLALLTLAALTPPGHEVVIEDENVGPITLDDRPDLVGITVNVDTSGRAYQIAGRYRARGVPVIVGGIHPSARPAEALRHADAVCIGEAEALWGRIVDDAMNGGLQRRYYNDHPTDLADVPVPRWDLVDQAHYLYTNVVVASRGCPFQCEFCYNSCAYVNRGYRHRPVEHVVAEIEQLDTKQVMFIDDNLLGEPRWTRQLVRAIKPLDLKWHAAVSTNLVRHPGLIEEMAESGCQSLFIGFETVNPEAVRSVRKYQNHVETYDQLIQALHDRGIMVNASLVFGFDHDGPDVFPDTLAWLVANKVETMTAHILTPYPGTVLYQRLLREGRIVDFDWTHYNTAHVVFRPQRMTREQLYSGYLWIYQEFYSFRNIIRRIPDSPAQRMPYLLFNLGYRKFGKVTSRVAQWGMMHALGRLARRLAYGIE